ncbi:uncharacterized protein LOC111308326 isoform X2 [Durio zibethinus]|uniref:Uncharacterized protein LOC111308326 isoform X2 n=1 Tax=Durio zibethinus TaxID=66656 RepID=A0A6P6AC44_DURZI|nr:uncharacterized protein LOC111308326 isoform X2 [Durio zibethinus]
MQNKMTSLQILNPVFSSISISQSNFPGKSDFRKKIFNFNKFRSFKSLHSQRSRIYCSTQEGDNKSNGKEPPESLFMKELKRRGMTPTSLLEDAKQTNFGLDEEMKVGEEAGSFSKRNAVSTEYEKSLSNQRERSMELNSEGLEYFGPSFIHDGSETPVSSPQFIDPYALLEDERISQTAPGVN